MVATNGVSAVTGVKIVKADLDEDDRGIIVTGFVAPVSLAKLQADA